MSDQYIKNKKLGRLAEWGLCYRLYQPERIVRTRMTLIERMNTDNFINKMYTRLFSGTDRKRPLVASDSGTSPLLPSASGEKLVPLIT